MKRYNKQYITYEIDWQCIQKQLLNVFQILIPF